MTITSTDIVASNGINIGVRVAGEGPVVLLVHGFPGAAYSWRHQLPALAEAGYRAVAVDTRGYGRSTRPSGPHHTSAEVQQDLLGVLDAYEAQEAFVVGQDFGSRYAWDLAQRHPSRVRAVVGTVPFLGPPSATPPSEGYARVAEEHFLHLHYFQEIGLAERELGGHVLREFLLRVLWALSGEGDLFHVYKSSSATSYVDALPPAPPLPWRWLSEEEFETFLADYELGGPGRELSGGLASYRGADADWADSHAWADTQILQPALLVMGEHDPVRAFRAPEIDKLRAWMPQLRDLATVADAGHHVQQEQPEAFNEVLLEFLASVR